MKLALASGMQNFLINSDFNHTSPSTEEPAIITITDKVGQQVEPEIP